MIEQTIKCDICKQGIPDAGVIGIETVVVEAGVVNIIIHKDEHAGLADSHVCGIQHLMAFIAGMVDQYLGAGMKKKPEPVALHTVCCEQGGEKCGIAFCSHPLPHIPTPPSG